MGPAMKIPERNTRTRTLQSPKVNRRRRRRRRDNVNGWCRCGIRKR